MRTRLTKRDKASISGSRSNTVGSLVAHAYKKLGVHGAAAAVHAHRDAHSLVRLAHRPRADPRALQGEPLDIVLPMTWTAIGT